MLEVRTLFCWDRTRNGTVIGNHHWSSHTTSCFKMPTTLTAQPPLGSTSHNKRSPIKGQESLLLHIGFFTCRVSSPPFSHCCALMRGQIGKCVFLSCARFSDAIFGCGSFHKNHNTTFSSHKNSTDTTNSLVLSLTPITEHLLTSWKAEINMLLQSFEWEAQF